MSILLEKLEGRDYCLSHYHYDKQLLPLYRKCDIMLWRLLMEESKGTNVERKAEMGRAIVAELATDFMQRNQGRFIAVTFRKKVLAVCDTLEALNKELARGDIKENYYIERIGHDVIAQV